MKNIVYSFCALFVATLLFSFTDAGEGKSTCDATNDKTCVVVFNDGTRVDATGVPHWQ
ncbi:hypothetical protein [Chitinophaga sp. Cy-1792]|uniref:hypothetical protein n=1 Tax=Chitinophaga sp. Cy-1792 TaxID=2608339 RepID=UPI0014240907|nr:hypothetical protein [Chitinophaga sp. Cy-1792]